MSVAHELRPEPQRMTATEALLSQAAAVTPEEVHAARLAIVSARECIRPLDRTNMLEGDGRAGRVLLADDRPSHWSGTAPGPSCAIRSRRLLERTDPT